MSYQYPKKGCFRCGNLGHIAEACSSNQRLCYNCRQPGHESAACPSPRTVSAKQCYQCGGVGHIQVDCPNLKVQGLGTHGGNQKCFTCGRPGHIARMCPNSSGGTNTNGLFAPRAPPPGRSLNTSTIPPVKCFRCGGLNHMSRDCLAAPGTTVSEQVVVSNGSAAVGNPNKGKICYKCQQEGHIARDCPQIAEYAA